MKNIPKQIRHLIFKDLRGQSSSQEQKDLDDWFVELDLSTSPLDKKSVLQIKKRQKKAIKAITKSKKLWVSWGYYRNIAAVLILFSLAALIFLLKQKENTQDSKIEHLAYQPFIANYGERKTIVLTDGSEVKLFGPTTLFIHPEFPKNRHTKLSGEAFFEITPDSLRPFLVDTEGFRLKVLGTSFLVKTDTFEGSSVAIKSGIVNVSRAQDFSENLEKNEIIAILPNSLTPIKKRINPAITFAKVDNTLWYEKTPLMDVLNDLKNWYGLEELTINIPIDKYFITGKFKNQSLKSILESISYSTNTAYELKDKKLKITAK